MVKTGIATYAETSVAATCFLNMSKKMIWIR